MEPQIQYATTDDGVSIAYYTMGQGMPLVVMPPIPVSHIQREWQIPALRRQAERLAEGKMLIRYDPRGLGLSERNVRSISLDTGVLDLSAVIDRLSVEKVALFAIQNSGPAAIAYAARHPDRVSHLVLWCARARNWDGPQADSIWESSLIEGNWEFYVESMVRAGLGWSEPELAKQVVDLYHEGISKEVMQQFMAAAAGIDASPMLSKVKAPTLVIHRRQVFWPTEDTAKELASRIPNARLILVEGDSLLPIVGDSEAQFRTIDEFLGIVEGEVAAASAAARSGGAGGLVTILFTDVESSTALTDRLGDEKARKLLREHERITREALKAHGGSEVKTLGDGFMTSFSSATKALQCAIAMQRAFAEHNESAAQPIRVRIGLNAGEPIAEDDPEGRSDLFGTAVNVAARIVAKTDGGEILVSNVVRELVAGKKFLFSDRGETELRGFADPVRVYEVRWQEGDPLTQ